MTTLTYTPFDGSTDLSKPDSSPLSTGLLGNKGTSIASDRLLGRARAAIGRAYFGVALACFACSSAPAQSLVATLPLSSPTAVAVNQTTNMVYVSALESASTANGYNTVTVIDGATNTVVKTIQAGGPDLNSLAVNSTTNTIYAVNGGTLINELSGNTVIPGSVAVIDGATNTVKTTIALPLYAGGIVVNPATSQAYVVLNTGAGNGEQFSVAIIDLATNTITDTISLGTNGMGSFTVDTTKNLAFGIGGNYPGNGVITVVDLAAKSVKTTIQVGYNDNTFIYNKATGTIYVPDAHSNQIIVVDAATDATSGTIPIEGTLESSFPAINTVTNKLYLVAYVNNAICVEVVDASSKATTTTSAITNIGPLLVDSVTNKIWEASSPVVIVDGATNAVTSVTGTSGISVQLGALNTTTNTAYIAGSTDVYVVSGKASGPALSPSPSPLAFGNQTEGTTSGAKTLTITNTGTSDLTITTVTPGGTDTADFIIGSDNCSNATVSAGKTCTVSVEFAPSTTSGESATLTFADNATGSPQTVDFTGTGIAPVPTATTTALSASSASVAVGTSVTFTATVTAAKGTPTPTGTVNFYDGATKLGVGTVNGSGVAAYSTSSLAKASHSITAVYGGDSRNLGSTSGAVNVAVTTGKTTTALTASATSVAVGTGVTFTATVTGASGVPAPTGTVTFMNGATALGTGKLSGSGTATYSASALATGSYSVTASYPGDADNAASASTAVAVTVWPGPAGFSVTLSPSSGSIAAGASAATTITVTSANGFASATSLSCSGLPTNSVCNFSQSSVTPAVSGKATSSLTIKTDTSATAALDRLGNGPGSPSESVASGIVMANILGALFLVPLLGSRRRKLRQLLQSMVALALLAIVAFGGITACGGSGGPKTPAGSYSVQVTATSGALTQKATFSLTVQ